MECLREGYEFAKILLGTKYVLNVVNMYLCSDANDFVV